MRIGGGVKGWGTVEAFRHGRGRGEGSSQPVFETKLGERGVALCVGDVPSEFRRIHGERCRVRHQQSSAADRLEHDHRSDGVPPSSTEVGRQIRRELKSSSSARALELLSTT